MTVQDEIIFKVNVWMATASLGQKPFQEEGDFLVYKKQSLKLKSPPLTDISSVSILKDNEGNFLLYLFKIFKYFSLFF